GTFSRQHFCHGYIIQRAVREMPPGWCPPLSSPASGEVMPKTLRPSVRAKIWSMVVLFLLGLGGLSLTGLFADRAMLIDEKRHSLRRLVESARSIVSHYHQLERSGQLSGAHAREGAREALRAMRYDE